MLILPPGHAAQQTRPLRPLATRERRLMTVIGAVAVALVAVTVVALLSAGHHSGGGCVDIKLPYSTGGAEIYSCGARARTTCATLGQSSGVTGAARVEVANECRKAGLPVG